MNIYEILNKITFKEHELLIDVTDVAKTLGVVNKYVDPWKVTAANCGWAKAPHCWFVTFKCSDEKWYLMLQDLKTKNVGLYPPTIGY